MWYVAVDWDHQLEDEPVLLYSEVDGSDELRKVVIYRDGRMDFSGPEGHTGTTTLSREMPGVEEINSQPEFRARTILAAQFETIYGQALRAHGLGQGLHPT